MMIYAVFSDVGRAAILDYARPDESNIYGSS